MSKDQRQTTERLDIARDRIAAEQTARTGRLDLGNLGLTQPPPELADLDWLEALTLGGVYERWGSTKRRSDTGEWEVTDEAYNSNHIEPIVSALTKLPHLRRLDCSGTELQDLSPLADLSALQSLDCVSPKSPIWRRWPAAPPCGDSTAGGPRSPISPDRSSDCPI